MLNKRLIQVALLSIIVFTIFATQFETSFAQEVPPFVPCSSLPTCFTSTIDWGISIGLAAGSIGVFIGRISSFLSSLLISLATLAITIGGIMYMLSGGNEQQAARAKKIVLYAMLGLLIGLIANWIALVIQGLSVGNFTWAGSEVDAFIWYFIYAISYFFISLAVLAIMFGGVMYVLSGGDEKRSSTAKNIIVYAILGLVIAGLANVIAWEVEDVVMGGDPIATRSLISNISNFFVGFIAILSALVIIIGGVMYTLSLGDEQRSARAKKIVLYAVVGLIISTLATVISYMLRQIVSPLLPASDPFFLAGGPSGAANIVTTLIGSIGVFVLSPLAMIAAGAIIYGGYMYITSAGEEDKARLGKRIILFTLLGVFIVLSAALIVNIVITL